MANRLDWILLERGRVRPKDPKRVPLSVHIHTEAVVCNAHGFDQRNLNKQASELTLKAGKKQVIADTDWYRAKIDIKSQKTFYPMPFQTCAMVSGFYNPNGRVHPSHFSP